MTGRASSTISAIVASAEPQSNETNSRLPLLDSEQLEAIRTFLIDALRTGCPSSTPKVRRHSLETYGVPVTERTLVRIIRKLGFRWQKGERRNIIVLRPSNQLYYASFCSNLLSNRHEGVVTMPEVYLDETYCYQSINNNRTWTFKDIPLSWQTSNTKVIIVGAGVI